MASLAVTMGLLMIVAKRGRDASLSREVFNASGAGGLKTTGSSGLFRKIVLLFYSLSLKLLVTI